MSYEVLTTDDDLLEYSRQTQLLIKVQLPLEYLQRSKVVVYRSKAGKIIAGYCLALKPPFRALQPLPEELHKSLQCPINKIIEVNGLWIDSKYRGGAFATKFWLSFLMNLIKSKKRYFIYSYSSKKISLARFYAMGRPQRIWSGDVYICGMDEPDTESVELAHIRKVVIWTMKIVYSKLSAEWGPTGIMRNIKAKRIKSA